LRALNDQISIVLYNSADIKNQSVTTILAIGKR